MKFATFVAVVLISCVSGSAWHARRDAESDTTCRNIYAQITAIMRDPQFRLLITDDGMSLDCSEQMLRRAAECKKTPFVVCNSQFSASQLNTALNVFCRHRTDIEDEPACWISDNVPLVVVSCVGDDRPAFALCAEQKVANLTECSATAGAIFNELILGVFGTMPE